MELLFFSSTVKPYPSRISGSRIVGDQKFLIKILNPLSSDSAMRTLSWRRTFPAPSILDRTSPFGESLAAHVSCNFCLSFHEITQKDSLFFSENDSYHFSTLVRRLLAFYPFE